MGIAVGIDLGTSNSVVAAIVDGEAMVFADREGRRVHPSVVGFGFGGSVTVGYRAKQQREFAPESTVYSVKRLIGRRYHSPEAEHIRKMVGWGLAEGPRGDARVRVQGRILCAEEVSAHVLVHMREIAEQATGQRVDAAVITVPAYFNDQQRKATRDASKIAGMKCLRIINEPTAAALAYGFRQGKRQRIAVYDLGGGTFDVSLLRLDDDVFEVVSTSGDTFLGGDDFDAVIVNHLLDELERKTGVLPEATRAVQDRILSAAEQAKVALSTQDIVEVRVPDVARDEAGLPIHLSVRLTRATLAKLFMPLLERTFEVCRDALEQAGLTPMQMDQVLLVGGMTRCPLVRDEVSAHFGRAVNDQINADEVVAVGAAIQAHNLSAFSAEPGAVLVDVTPHTLGVGTVGGFVEPLIHRNTPIPTDGKKRFHTAHDHQTEVRVRVFQGESRVVTDNELLGEFVLSNLRAAFRGEVQVQIRFRIDSDGCLTVTAKDRETGNAVDMVVEASSGLTEEDLEDLSFEDVGF